MIYLTIRTDKPEAEIGLFDGDRQMEYIVWQAHRELSTTIHLRLNELLDKQQKKWQDVQGIVAFAGPGSFTGLRIGLSVANALASSLSIPIVGIEGEEQWIQRGQHRLQAGEQDVIALPEYGADVHITPPKRLPS